MNQAMIMAIPTTDSAPVDEQALVQRLHDAVVRAEPDEIGADDRGQDADRADAERQQQHGGRASAPVKKIAASSMVATIVTA